MDAKTHEAIAKSIGRHVARGREAVRLSQKQLAADLGLGSEALSRIERGATMPSLPRLYQIAERLGMDPVDVLARANQSSAGVAAHLGRKVERLSAGDRKFVLETLERFIERLEARGEVL